MPDPEIHSDRHLEDRKQREMERAHDALRAVITQATEAAVQSGQVAARTLILINGGAAVAMLAFLGNVTARGQHSLANVADSLMYFAAGVTLGAVTSCAAFLVNLCASHGLEALDPIREHPYYAEKPIVKKWRKGAVFFQVVAIAAGLASLVLFVWGAWEIRGSIIALGSK